MVWMWCLVLFGGGVFREDMVIFSERNVMTALHSQGLDVVFSFVFVVVGVSGKTW